MLEKQELGIYIHIPFCVRKCYYCDFISFPNCYEKVDKYIKTVIDEINEFDFTKYNVTTIYIGGGTPSSIESKYIAEILECIKLKIKNNLTEFKNIEITIEVNPGTVDKEKLLEYKLNGINRLSIGLQSTNNVILKNIGRIHTYEQFLETYSLAKKVGFKNINVDLMLGLPEQSIQDLKESLDAIIKLEPEHISVYSLIVEEGTKIENMLINEEIELPDEECERNMYWYVKNTLELNGYNQYEISNFAKKGKESKHNMNCWEQKQYVGIGVAAHSYVNKTRYSNSIDINKYIKNHTEKIIQEEQTKQDEKKEFMMLGFRKIEGIKISSFKEKFGENPIFLFRKELNKLIENGLVVIDLDNIKLTNKGIDFANLVFEEFI